MSAAAQDSVRAADGLRLHRRRWLPPAGAPVRARLLLVHGMGEHLGRYEEAGAFFAARGIAVQGADLRGHGLSAGRRGHVRRWAEYGLDLDAAAPEAPFAVLAHSMGGLVALDWARERLAAGGGGPSPAALVLSGPLLDVAVPIPAWKRALSGALARLLPALPLASGIPLPWLCTDPAEVAAYERDPLRVSVCTPRWYVEMQAARRRALAALPAMRLPAQFHLAGDERVVSAAAVESGFAAWGGPKELQRWPGGRHEILREPFRAQVLERIADFVLEHA